MAKMPWDEEEDEEMEGNEPDMDSDEDVDAQKNVLMEIMKMADESESSMLRDQGDEDPREGIESSIMIDAKKEKKEGGGGGGGMMGGGGMSMDMDKLKKIKGGFGG